MTGQPHDNTSDPARAPEPTGPQGRASGLLPTLAKAAVPVLLVTALAGYAAQQYSERQPDVYESTSRVVLSASTNFSPVDGSFSGGDANRYVQNQADIMTTVAVLDRAAGELADGSTGADLRDDISAAPSGASEVITITARADDGALAARRADAVARAYAAYTAEQVRLLADQAAEVVRTDPAQVLSIRARAVTFGDGVSETQPAVAPTDPASPTPRRNAYLAATAAFLLSVGLVLALRGTRRSGGRDRLVTDAGAPVLGTVPVRGTGGSATLRQPGGDRYALALQALRYRTRDSGRRSVLLSPLGRDTSAASAVLGLAAADAAQGRRVVVVDASADGHLLDRAGVSAPALALHPGAPPAGGGLDALLRPVPALAGPNGGAVLLARIDPAAPMAADTVRAALAELEATADLVLVDAGAAGRSASAFGLLGEVGAVVAVVRGRGGRRDERELAELRQKLALAGRTCDGVLVTERTWLPTSGGSDATAATTAPASPAPTSPAPTAPASPSPAGASAAGSRPVPPRPPMQELDPTAGAPTRAGRPSA
jgi:capsular polysaccharide biosynthesis protein